MDKSVVITGITGQDGSILAEQLLQEGYVVYGLKRRTSSNDLGCAKHLTDIEIVEGDITDLVSMQKLCNLARPDLFFHCAAQSHVGSSFDQPIFTLQNNTVGTLNCLEAIRTSGIHTRFLHTATSEMYGGMTDKPANEATPFHPRSPYGVSKLASYWLTINFKESYKMFACNSICFNHEEPGKRGPNFVTRKISLAVAAIIEGRQDKLYLGNLEAKRDWGLASDYCQGMIMMLDAAAPTDYVLATGETHSVREFCKLAFEYAGLGDYREYVEIDPRFYRPCEVDVLIGDASKIRDQLGWMPRTSFKHLVHNMVDYDLQHK